MPTSPRCTVSVRPVRAVDRDAFVALARASIEFHAGLVKPPRTAGEFAAYLRRSRLESNAFLVVVRRDDNALVGAINFSQIFHGAFKNAYMGYFVFAPYAGNGYMTEGMRLALRVAARTLKLHRVEANIQPGNESSIRLVKRLGFAREGYSPRYLKIGGRWCDHERWAKVLAGSR